jgi:hypothetical protein
LVFPVFVPVLMAAGILGPVAAARLWRDISPGAGLQRRA